MRIQRLLSAVILACGVSACAKDVTGVVHPVPPLAFVRYINAVSDTFNMDFRAVDQVTYSQPFLNTQYRDLGNGGYQGYQAGSRHVRIFLNPAPANNTVAVDPVVVSTVMVDTTYTFVAGTYYTLLHVGNARAGSAVKEQLMIITDALPTQSTATIQGRIINAAPTLGAVDVYVRADGTTPLSGAASASSLGFKSATTWMSQAPGAWVIRLTTPGTVVTQGAAAGYTLQVGTAGTTTLTAAPGVAPADPIFGSGQGGSIFTAVIFDASPAPVSKAAQFATPGVVYYPDMQPPRTTSP